MELIIKNIEDSHYVITNRGDIINSKTKRVLRWRKMPGNRYRVNLYYNGKRNPKYINCLLSEYFKDNEIDLPFETVIVTRKKIKLNQD
jgi:hypothetical protein